jgi:hypothetical protein
VNDAGSAGALGGGVGEAEPAGAADAEGGAEAAVHGTPGSAMPRSARFAVLRRRRVEMPTSDAAGLVAGDSASMALARERRGSRARSRRPRS